MNEPAKSCEKIGGSQQSNFLIEEGLNKDNINHATEESAQPKQQKYGTHIKRNNNASFIEAMDAQVGDHDIGEEDDEEGKEQDEGEDGEESVDEDCLITDKQLLFNPLS